MDHVFHLVVTYGYVLIFILVFLDHAAVSVPSPPFVTAMGVLASSGRFDICSAFVVVLVAAFLADCLWFRVGLSAAGGFLGLLRSRHWNEHFPKIVSLVRRGVLVAILSVKFSLLPSALVPFAAGSTRLTTRRFLCMAAVGNLAWTAVYLMGGFTAGHAVMNVMGRRSVLIGATLAGCLLLVLPAALQWMSVQVRQRRDRRRQS
jgi:membrane protein DedA with SNARE-associated domain